MYSHTWSTRVVSAVDRDLNVFFMDSLLCTVTLGRPGLFQL